MCLLEGAGRPDLPAVRWGAEWNFEVRGVLKTMARHQEALLHLKSARYDKQALHAHEHFTLTFGAAVLQNGPRMDLKNSTWAVIGSARGFAV